MLPDEDGDDQEQEDDQGIPSMWCFASYLDGSTLLIFRIHDTTMCILKYISLYFDTY